MSNITYAERKRIYTQAMDTYGVDHQLVVALEELSEVQKEICKAARGELDLSHLIEEVADVAIVLEQIRLIFGIADDQISAVMDSKLRRLLRRIEGEDPLWK